MKVLFLKDVPRVARKSEIKEVADGYAYNNLIPRKLAVPATPEHVRRTELGQARTELAQANHESQMRGFFKRVEIEPIRLVLPANEKGHLFKGVRISEICDEIERAYGITLDAKELTLSTPLKETGTHRVPVRSGGVSGECVVIIEKK